MKATVLGGGLVGSAIARDLAAGGEFSVRLCDISERVLNSFSGEKGIEVFKSDLSSGEEVKRAVQDSDIVVGAVPGFMGFDTVRSVISSGKDMVDISFFPEDALELDELARKNNVRCLVDFGVAPGCSNLICGHSLDTFSRIDRFSCMVGGLPMERKLPWEYQAPFSPVDVLEEYTRPARIVRNGKITTLPPLTESELVDFPGVGTLEAFLTDGLRSLLKIEGIPDMVEKTLRYPGYIEKVKLFIETGFLSSEPVRVGNKEISPMELTSSLLIKAWRQKPGDWDITVMRISVSGIGADGKNLTEIWNLHDCYDCTAGTSSMARTTGYACTAGVRMLKNDLWRNPGVHPPENVGREKGCFDFILADMAERGIRYNLKSCID